MSYEGIVQGGVVVLPADVRLPEGTKVHVEPVTIQREATTSAADDPVFRMYELAFDAGVPDLATNADHYLYGHPRGEA